MLNNQSSQWTCATRSKGGSVAMVGSDDDWGAWKSDRGSMLRARGPARLQERGPWHVLGVPHTASADEIHYAFQALALDSLFENPLETESAKASQSANRCVCLDVCLL